MAACPSSPDNIKTIAELNDLKVDQVIIGSCTNSSLKDLMLVAKALKGKTVHSSLSAAIAPGSRQVLRMLAENGALADLIAAGVRILESGCGPCIGQGTSPANGAVSVRTFNRNFAGRTGTTGDQAYLVSPETAIAAILTGKLTSPLKLNLDYPEWIAPDKFTIDDSLILAPANVCKNESADQAGIIRKETIGDPPKSEAFPVNIRGEVIIKVGDKITTDHIMPAGVHLKLRSNIPRYSKVVFECFTEPGKPSFAERAETCRDSGKQGVIVASESYGQGSSREHAAICPMYLGIRVVIAKSIERIHSANLINFGILPLVFTQSSDYDLIADGAELRIDNCTQQIQSGKQVKIELTLANGSQKEIICEHQMSPKDVETVVAGGVLNQ
jgi:aconitate hydratase